VAGIRENECLAQYDLILIRDPQVVNDPFAYGNCSKANHLL